MWRVVVDPKTANVLRCAASVYCLESYLFNDNLKKIGWEIHSRIAHSKVESVTRSRTGDILPAGQIPYHGIIEYTTIE